MHRGLAPLRLWTLPGTRRPGGWVWALVSSPLSRHTWCPGLPGLLLAVPTALGQSSERGLVLAHAPLFAPARLHALSPPLRRAAHAQQQSRATPASSLPLGCSVTRPCPRGVQCPHAWLDLSRAWGTPSGWPAGVWEENIHVSSFSGNVGTRVEHREPVSSFPMSSGAPDSQCSLPELDVITPDPSLGSPAVRAHHHLRASCTSCT